MGDDYKSWVPEFDPMNLELACLAADAAVDISNYVLGHSQEAESVRYLSSLLEQATKEDALLDLGYGFVLGFAISGRENPEEYWEGKSTSEVLLQINLVAKDLRDFKRLPRLRQESLAEFCVRLSQEIISYRNSYPHGVHRLIA